MTEETARVLALAREWYTDAAWDPPIGHEGITRFLKLWIALNALFEMRFPQENGDHNQLRAFANWAPVSASHQLGLPTQTYHRSVLLLAEKGVYNHRKKLVVHVTDLASASEVFEAVYQVRCNLFHGKKTPYDLRDTQLIQAAGNIVAHTLSRVIHDDTLWDAAA